MSSSLCPATRWRSITTETCRHTGEMPLATSSPVRNACDIALITTDTISPVPVFPTLYPTHLTIAIDGICVSPIFLCPYFAEFVAFQ